MKLKNKKTGVIGDLVAYDADKGIFAVKAQGGDRCYYYSLAALHEVWEDYEEPKSINEIDVVLDAIGEYCNEHSYYSGDLEKIKILNSVEEKLKAWKRLKINGFKFNGWRTADLGADKYYFVITAESDGAVKGDLDLLFGGEE